MASEKIAFKKTLIRTSKTDIREHVLKFTERLISIHTRVNHKC